MEALKNWRKGLPKGFQSLDAAGRLLGVSGVQMFRYENGLRRVPGEKAKAISAITNIPVEVLRPDIFGPPRPLRSAKEQSAVG